MTTGHRPGIVLNMHFCQDEAMALLASIPAIGYAVKRFRAYLTKKSCNCPTHTKRPS